MRCLMRDSELQWGGARLHALAERMLGHHNAHLKPSSLMIATGMAPPGMAMNFGSRPWNTMKVPSLLTPFKNCMKRSPWVR